MDVFSHGLWTNLIYFNTDDPVRLLAIGLSIAPDVITFAPEYSYAFYRGELRILWRDFRTDNVEAVAKKTPSWVYRLYELTHSIPIWIAGFLLWWWMAGTIPWPAFAWLLHILIDIPTHPKKYFPTPFLWPLSKFKIDGINWGLPWFIAFNYASLIILYLYLYFFFLK